MTKEETELEKVIQEVDENATDTLIRIRVSFLRYAFIAVMLFALLFAYNLSLIAVQAAKANMLELSTSLDGDATAIAALGLVFFGLVFTRDWKDDEKEKAERLRFEKLKGKTDPVTSRALIRMRIDLPRGITLKQARAANPDLFTEKEFARRLIGDRGTKLR